MKEEKRNREAKTKKNIKEKGKGNKGRTTAATTIFPPPTTATTLPHSK
jgi:hypothetical protein